MTFVVSWKHHYLSKNWCGYFLGNFRKIGLFLFHHLVRLPEFDGSVVKTVLPKIYSKHFPNSDQFFLGCMMSCAWKDDRCRIGMILGTGTNACYLEEIKDIHTIEKEKFQDQVRDRKCQNSIEIFLSHLTLKSWCSSASLYSIQSSL